MEETTLITLTDEDGSQVDLYVLEETKINGRTYLLVTEEPEGDCEALVLEELPGGEGEDASYRPVEDDAELALLSDLFSELLDDVSFE